MTSAKQKAVVDVELNAQGANQQLGAFKQKIETTAQAIGAATSKFNGSLKSLEPTTGKLASALGQVASLTHGAVGPLGQFGQAAQSAFALFLSGGPVVVGIGAVVAGLGYLTAEQNRAAESARKLDEDARKAYLDTFAAAKKGADDAEMALRNYGKTAQEVAVQQAGLAVQQSKAAEAMAIASLNARRAQQDLLRAQNRETLASDLPKDEKVAAILASSDEIERLDKLAVADRNRVIEQRALTSEYERQLEAVRSLATVEGVRAVKAKTETTTTVEQRKAASDRVMSDTLKNINASADAESKARLKVVKDHLDASLAKRSIDKDEIEFREQLAQLHADAEETRKQKEIEREQAIADKRLVILKDWIQKGISEVQQFAASFGVLDEVAQLVKFSVQQVEQFAQASLSIMDAALQAGISLAQQFAAVSLDVLEDLVAGEKIAWAEIAVAQIKSIGQVLMAMGVQFAIQAIGAAATGNFASAAAFGVASAGALAAGAAFSVGGAVGAGMVRRTSGGASSSPTGINSAPRTQGINRNGSNGTRSDGQQSNVYIFNAPIIGDQTQAARETSRLQAHSQRRLLRGGR